MSKSDDTFINAVQEHERRWGTDTYPNRPELSDLLSASIVAFWIPAQGEDKRMIATIHADLDEINKYALRVLIHSRAELPNKRLARIYVNQQKATIQGVQVFISGVDS